MLYNNVIKIQKGETQIMKKKVIILIGLLMSLSLSACGSSGTAASKGDETKAEDTQQETTEGDQEKADEGNQAAYPSC